MKPESVTLDDATAAKLAAANGNAIPLCNAGGGVVAYGISPERLAKLLEAFRNVAPPSETIWTQEELKRIAERVKDKSRPKRSMEEVLRLVEGQ